MNKKNKGYALVLVIVIIVIFAFIGAGLLTMSYGARLNSIRMKNETVALLAAEAGYEKAKFWMSKQQDMLFRMKTGGTYSDTVNFTNSDSDFQVSFFSFAGAKPIYKIISNGNAGNANRTIEVLMMQAVGGWEMGMCRVPRGTGSTTTNTVPVNFANGEIIDMPIHINSYGTNLYDNNIDIHISGNPTFTRTVSMSESRTSSGGNDKYASVMGSFDGGISFLQPLSQITNETAIAAKVDTFAENTKTEYKFTPVASSAAIPNKSGAVQLEFFVDNGVGKVRITNNCTVAGQNGGQYDYKIRPGTNGATYEKYPIYKYHYINNGASRPVVNIEDTYVTQEIGGTQSEAGGQIYVDGNVIVGGDDTTYDINGRQIVKGKITVVATGNIWIADSIIVDGAHASTGSRCPNADNPNALGLISKKVVKVVDPGLSAGASNRAGLTYERVGIDKGNFNTRYLPNSVEIEAAITVGGGGWGAENVGNRREYSGNQDNLIVRGVISEAVRGVVGVIGTDGFLKFYYVDERMLQGILPGDMWLKSKYVPAPAGWKDYRP